MMTCMNVLRQSVFVDKLYFPPFKGVTVAFYSRYIPKVLE